MGDIVKIHNDEPRAGTNDPVATLNEQARRIIDLSKHVDAETLAPRVLAVVVAAMSESVKVFEDNGSDFKAAVQAIKYTDCISVLSSAGVIPDEMYEVCWRINSTFLHDSRIFKTASFRESEVQKNIIDNWSNSVLSDLTFIGSEVVLPDGDRVDILAKDDDGRDVIVEIKLGKKDGYRQLRSYAVFYDSPRLINLSEKPIKYKKEGIEYRTFTMLHGSARQGGAVQG